ncbi:MAG: SRPBCC domain-containing protein [Caulobacter sp.]|nr:SRPBCC domain-containing protein [Caulobacter sp.]
MKTLLAGLAAVLVLAGAASAADKAPPRWSDFKGVENSSFVEPGGRRVLQLSILVPASPAKVWQAISTEAGWKTWAAPSVWVDFRIGGTIESNYAAGAVKGHESNIVNRIEAYVPGRMLAIRNIQAPKGFFSTDAFGQTATILELDPVGDAQTRVTLSNVGYGQGADFDSVYKHFEWGDAYTLAELAKRFETGPAKWAAPEQKDRTANAVDTMKTGE